MNYDFLLNTLSAKSWKKIGTKKRKGVMVPLFSLYSKRSFCGIGDAIDLFLMIDWCKKTKHSILQLLPLNSLGSDFSPYNHQSSFALEPMYLSLNHLKQVEQNKIKEFLNHSFFNFNMDRNFEKIKSAKMKILEKIFLEWADKDSVDFNKYKENNFYWLSEYANFKVLKKIFNEKKWTEWKEIPENLKTFEKDLLFEKWLQWQLFEQFKIVKKYAEDNGVFLMGDLPLLVSYDSSDVWSWRNYFKLDLTSGAPPDMYQANGQRWDMPPYNWQEIAANNYNYLIQKLKYAENFYHLYRIDHAVGLFRIWTISINEPLENAGLNGQFDPKDEIKWEEQGKTIISIMINNTEMLACAEDLGVVPDICYKTLEKFGIPGMEVQRWTKYWNINCEFKKPEDYRKIAISCISNHDMSNFIAWWKYESETIDENFFKRKCQEKKLDYNLIKEKLFCLKNSCYGRLKWKKKIENINILQQILNTDQNCWEIIKMYQESIEEKNKFLQRLKIEDNFEEIFFEENFYKKLLLKSLEYAKETYSIFTIQSILDLILLDDKIREKINIWEFRINSPGTINKKNWSLKLPISLEELLDASFNEIIP
ncbi:MAG: 4-alpha-glucanotransferase [bacterium]